MKTSVDRFGRVLVPKKLRTHAGLKPGTALEAVEAEDGVLLRPVRRKPDLIRKDGVLVYTGEVAGDLKNFVHEMREERLGKAASFV